MVEVASFSRAVERGCLGDVIHRHFQFDELWCEPGIGSGFPSAQRQLKDNIFPLDGERSAQTLQKELDAKGERKTYDQVTNPCNFGRLLDAGRAPQGARIRKLQRVQRSVSYPCLF